MNHIKYLPYVAILILLVVAGFYYQKVRNLERENKIEAQNNLALTDSLTVVKTKNGDLEASKAGFIATEKELKKLNSELADEVKETEGKVLTLSRANIRLALDNKQLREALRDTIPPEEPIQINDSTYTIPWNIFYQYNPGNSDYYEGKTRIEIGIGNPYLVRHIMTELTKKETKIDLTFGQRIEDDKLRVFLRSGYPGFTADQLDGVLIDPNSNPYLKGLIKKRHWFTGLGIGPNMSMGYDFLNQRPALIFGVGIQYNIYHW